MSLRFVKNKLDVANIKIKRFGVNVLFIARTMIGTFSLASKALGSMHLGCVKSQSAARSRLQKNVSEDHYLMVETDLVSGAKFYVEAELDLDGTLTLDFDLRRDDGSRSNILKVKEQFQKILGHFGREVRRIRGVWQNYSDNFITYQSLISQTSESEAAASTWTGRQALAAGFTRIRRVANPGSNVISFDFEKPR